MKNKKTFLKFLFLPAIGFGIGGLFWGWAFAKAAYYGNPGFATDYWMNGLIFGVLGGIFISLLKKNYCKTKLILNSALGAFLGFVIGNTFGILLIIPFVLIISLLSSFLSFAAEFNAYLLYGEVGNLFLLGTILTIFLISAIKEERYPFKFSKDKKIVFLDVILGILGICWIFLSNLNILALGGLFLFLLVLNYIFLIEKKFLKLSFKIGVILVIAYLVGMKIGTIIHNSYNLYFLYLPRFIIASFLFGIYLGWQIWRLENEKEEN